MKKATRSLGLALLALPTTVVLVALSRQADAVPVFARKYQTSCQTCHTIFPKLNAFGEAFRLNGYRMPAETEEQVKQPPVSMGSEAYKRVWPDAVYPNSLPGAAPFALNVKMASLYISTHDENGRQLIQNDFQFPQEANLFSAGTLGDHFSFFGEVTYAEKPGGGSDLEIEHARLDIDSAFGPEHAFNFKLGKFAPDVYDGFQEMWLMTDTGVDTMFTYNPIGFHGGTGLADSGGGVSLPGRVRGIEMYGVAAHRFFYTVGVANPIGPTAPNGAFGSNRKDMFARLDYKFGGMGLDGDTTGVTMPPENWREKSVRVGVLGYSGDGAGITYPIADDAGNKFSMEDRRYNRVGVFLSWYFQDLNVTGVALHGTDQLRLLDNGTGARLDENTRSYNAWFAQADYVIKPPFQVSLRYENLTPADPAAPALRFANANFSFLIRANVKAMIEYRRDLHDAKNYQIATVLRVAY